MSQLLIPSFNLTQSVPSSSFHTHNEIIHPSGYIYATQF